MIETECEERRYGKRSVAKCLASARFWGGVARNEGVSSALPRRGSRFCEEKGGNSLFPEAKERTIADCRDKMEIPIRMPKMEILD